MKQLIAFAGALALASCGGGDDADVAGTDEAPVAEVETAAAESPLVGSYGGTTEDGEPWTSSINADGSYEDTVAGEVTETGSWTHIDDEICFNPAVMEGETAEQTCMALLEVNEDGSLHLRDPDGKDMTVSKI